MNSIRRGEKALVIPVHLILLCGIALAISITINFVYIAAFLWSSGAYILSLIFLDRKKINSDHFYSVRTNEF